MLLFSKVRKIPKGSFLLEAVVAVAVLSVGLLTVMQSFSAQRKSVVLNVDYTRATLLLEDRLGALWAGVAASSAQSETENVQVESVELSDNAKGLKKVTLITEVFGDRKVMVDSYVADKTD